ncbi:MAG: AsmA family protein [Casimicrobiaceae bacterium]
MRTTSKVFVGAGVLVLVLVVGIAVAVALVDVNSFIGPLQTQVKAATGRDLVVRGGARLALSLQPKLVLSDVTLSNAPWGTTPQMLTAQRLELEVALLPLLSRRVELIEFGMVGPVITLESDAKGQKNWDLAAGPAAPVAPAPAATTPSPAALFSVGDVEIANGTLVYRDLAGGGVTQVAIDKLSLRARNKAAPMDVEFRGKVNDIAVAVEGTLGPLDALLQKRWPYAVDVKGEIAGHKIALATKVRAEDTKYSLDDLRIAIGANTLAGSFSAVTDGPRPKLLFDLSGSALALNELPAPAAAAASPPSPPAKGPQWIFPDVPVNFGLLRTFDADGALAVGGLTLPDGKTLNNLRVKMTLAAGKLDVPAFSTAAWGGTLAGSFIVDASQPAGAALTLRVHGKDLALGALIEAAGVKREVRGAKTELALNLAMRGASPHAWASSASGNVSLVAGPGTLVNTKVPIDASVDKLLDNVNPFRNTDPSTELVCAVVRFPIANGVARVDRGIAMETSKLGVSAIGTLDFRNETLDLGFQPKVRKGITLPVPNFAELVRFSGPFRSPQVKVDAAGSVAAIASIGAAIGTGGWSLLGQTLLAWADGGGPGPCQVALGTKESASANAEPATSGSSVADDVGKAIGKLFGK